MRVFSLFAKSLLLVGAASSLALAKPKPKDKPAPAPAAAASGVAGTVDATPAKYLGDTVVFLKGVPGAPTAKTLTLDQKGMMFSPHILLIAVGDTVKFLNHDKVDHNVFTTEGEAYNLGMIKNGESKTFTFKKAGAYPQLCSVHPEMLGYIWVGQNRYASVVGADGQFTIPNVPPGTYQVGVWNPKLKAAEQSVTVVAGKPTTVKLSLKR